jgi:hypothetical protein
VEQWRDAILSPNILSDCDAEPINSGLGISSAQPWVTKRARDDDRDGGGVPEEEERRQQVVYVLLIPISEVNVVFPVNRPHDTYRALSCVCDVFAGPIVSVWEWAWRVL